MPATVLDRRAIITRPAPLAARLGPRALAADLVGPELLEELRERFASRGRPSYLARAAAEAIALCRQGRPEAEVLLAEGGRYSARQLVRELALEPYL